MAVADEEALHSQRRDQGADHGVLIILVTNNSGDFLF